MNLDWAMKVATLTFSYGLYSEDIISYYTCQQIAKQSIFSNISSTLSEKSLTRILYLICNTSMLLYQYFLQITFYYL